MRPRPLFGAAASAWLACALVAACAHLSNYAAGPTPGTTPSPGASQPPCATPNPNPSVHLIFMTVTATATTDPLYGIVNGYTDEIDLSGFSSDLANVVVVAPSTQVQFVNLDASGPAAIAHSAVAFPAAAAFPVTPYAFPTSAAQPIGTAIASTLWSTGRVVDIPNSGFACASQVLTAPSTTGAFLFGDYDYYNSVNMRDAIVVSTSATPTANRRRGLLPRTPSR